MTTDPGDENLILLGLDQGGMPVHMRVLRAVGIMPCRDPWLAEFAQLRTARGKLPLWRDDGPEEDMPKKDREKPSFGIGSQVVFRDSDPETRHAWTVAEFDHQPGLPAWGAPLETCTIRRGSTVKRGVSIDRLELVPSG